MNLETKGILFVVTGTLLFSSKAIIVKYLYQFGISPLQLQTLRMLFVLPAYLIILGWVATRSGWGLFTLRELFACLAAGIACYHVASYLDLKGLLYISAGLERIILFCYPAIAVLMGWLFLKEKPSSKLWVSLLLSYAGILVFFYADLNMGGDNLILGSLLVFLASILTAWYMLANQVYSRKIGSQRFVCLGMIAASISLLIHSSIVGTEDLMTLSVEEYIGAGVIAFFCTLIPSFVLSAGIKIIGASKAGVVGTVGPLVTILLSNMLLGEPLIWMHFVGVVLVIAGMRLLK